MPSAPNRGRSLREVVVAAWSGSGDSPRTRPVFVASICAGVLGFTLASAFHVALVLSFLITVVGVFLVTTLVLLWRGRAG